MRTLFASLLLLCLITAFACRESSGPGHPNPRTALTSVDHFGVQFSGDYSLARMLPYQMMIIDPDQSRRHEADSLSARGIIPVAYINIGEAESYRWYYKDIRPEWMLGANPNWPDHFYVDASKSGWHSLLIDQVLPVIFGKSFKGIFLDMVDVASPDLYPMLRPGVVELIHAMREEFPDKIILMNNGTFLAPEVADAIDGIVVESVFATYNFKDKTYIPVRKDASETRCAELAALHTSYGLRIFAIDYAPEGDSLTRAYARNQSRSHGFSSFVSTIELNTLPAR
ncbi:MAG TPA: endo alpha-1,4 polygalactosaminidase [Bacteroidota bacterium]|nr:endo alpha-1,4 polygalactosaminidase [Bacteroidota bacterium]